jgi:uncharacterized protein YndB with AHSA1/START domain
MATRTKSDANFVGQEFTIVRELAAPRDLVWRACTEPNHLAQWWGPKGFTAPVCEWTAKPGGRIFVVMRAPDGADFPMGGEFREIVPPEKLVTVTGALDGNGKMLFEFLHTLTLAETSGKTRLTMHSRVISATPEAGRYLGGFETGMTMSLERLGEHLAQNTEPLVVERIYHAPVESVWQAISMKEKMQQWFFDVKEFKAEVGCEFGFVVEHEGNTFDHRCKVAEVIPEKRLAFTWRYQGYDGDSLVSFDLFAEGEKTRLKLTHLGLEKFPKLPQFARENFAGGWTSLIGTELEKYLATKPST